MQGSYDGAGTRDLDTGLYLVATPIGTARDITLRALDILNAADVLAAEDTRSLRRLMEIHGVAVAGRPMIAYHDHSNEKTRARLVAALEEGKSVVYASEAGTPMVADPGYALVRAVRDAGHAVVSAPGPSAAITALTLSGLPTDRFLFEGFLPSSKGKRKSALKTLAQVPTTLIFYESSKRLGAMLQDAADVLGGTRQATICREMTKKFEEIIPGNLDDLADAMKHRTLKGEIVVIVERGDSEKINWNDLDLILNDALKEMSVRDATAHVVEITGLKRREVYQRALEIAKKSDPRAS